MATVLFYLVRCLVASLNFSTSFDERKSSLPYLNIKLKRWMYQWRVFQFSDC